MGEIFIFLAVLLLFAKFGSSIKKLGQPVVMGEIIAGIMLSAIGFAGVPFVSAIRDNEIIRFISELGIVILLFQVGFEAEVDRMLKAGFRSFLVAVIGIVVPFFVTTFFIAPLLFPGEDFNTKLFLGLSLVATSVGIIASIFREAKQLKSDIFQTILGAAVIDDIIGLNLLAIVSVVTSGKSLESMAVVIIFLKSFGFLLIATVLGRLIAHWFSRIMASISTDIDMKLSFALIFVLVYAYLAEVVGLSPIIGAFAAGIAIDIAHFHKFDPPWTSGELTKLRGFNKEERKKIDGLVNILNNTHIDELIANIGVMFIPVFFVYTGLQVDIASFLKPELYIDAFIISLFAIATKLIAGIAASGGLTNKFIVGMAMVPRGEVGLIFAAIGKQTGVLTGEMYSILLIVVLVTTFISLPAVEKLLINQKKKNE